MSHTLYLLKSESQNPTEYPAISFLSKKCHTHCAFLNLCPTVPQSILLYYFQVCNVTHIVSSFLWLLQSHRVSCYIFLSIQCHTRYVFVCLRPTVRKSVLLYYFKVRCSVTHIVYFLCLRPINYPAI